MYPSRTFICLFDTVSSLKPRDTAEGLKLAHQWWKEKGLPAPFCVDGRPHGKLRKVTNANAYKCTRTVRRDRTTVAHEALCMTPIAVGMSGCIRCSPARRVQA